jgi:hypothetical protein
MGKRRIEITVEDFEYREIDRYARAKGHGSRYPVSAFVHYAVFQQMKKYPLSGAEKTRYVVGHGNSPERLMAVQPGALEGNLEKGTDVEINRNNNWSGE